MIIYRPVVTSDRNRLNHMAKTNEELALSIIKKCGYSIDFDPYELDENDEEILENGEGYFWEGDGGKSEYFDSEDEAIEDCLCNLDSTDIKLTKAESKYLDKFLSI